MTPAEIAALRERLAQYALDAERCQLSQGAADIRAALALLDAQAAEIARLTAAMTGCVVMICECADVPKRPDSLIQMVHAELDRALAPAPAAEVAG